MDAIHTFEGYGYLRECEVEGDMRDAMGGTLYSSTSDIQRNIIADQWGSAMIHSLSHALEQAAARFPEQTALRCDGQGITYAALNQRVTSLACLLRDRGVQRGDRVGLYLRKSIDAVVSVYGTMRAGAAYVPLDPFAPTARLIQVIEDCGIRCLITDADSTMRLRSFVSNTSVACLVGISAIPDIPIPCIPWSGILARNSERGLESPVERQDLAYILYTSGSTGTPKGIVHTHASALGFAQWAADEYDLRPADRVSNHAPLHFDLSTFDLFAAMLRGATTVIIPEYLTKFPVGLAQLLSDEHITVWYSVPYALIQLLEHGNLSMWNLTALRWVLFAGESFPTKHLCRLMARFPRARFSNLYGPTETNVCTYYHVPPILADGETAIPIGRACAGIAAIVVDEYGQPVPPGEGGELWVSGPTTMRGYWGRPQLDVQSFVPAPGGDDEGARFYRTGDLVRRLPDGNLLYLGRKDRQVKIRGYRVELDEIEAALLSHAEVQEAVVYTVPDGRGSYELAGTVIPMPGATLTERQLKQHTAQRLPSHARPAAIAISSALPRTSTGKTKGCLLQQRASSAQATT
jgi:amino acid adenylation domain-containing protein